EVVRFALREGFLALLLGPVALASIVVFALPYWLTDRIGRWAPNLQSRAVWQIIGGGLLHGAWITMIAATIGSATATVTGVATGIGLAALAVAGTLAVERESNVWRTTRAFFALRQMPLRARSALRRRRKALADALDDVRAWVERTTQY
ncbi:MAG: hypothetical protein OXF98_04135, partial [Rhodospirillaceae bacterium]|nr:hypothetical protein [Rhodospirillaceae bacterium]